MSPNIDTVRSHRDTGMWLASSGKFRSRQRLVGEHAVLYQGRISGWLDDIVGGGDGQRR